MPLIQVHTSAAPLSPERTSALLGELSQMLARELGKPERYMLTQLAPRSAMTFGGTDAPACFAELSNIGELSEAQTAALSDLLCRLLSEGLGVARNRIYLQFRNVEPHLWGYDGGTFA
jgi:phenylpyruvate tautomerase PptA (4-oxalocrotonate tautomerase family)